MISDGEDCFFREYKRKLEKLYDRFFTERGTKLAAKRRAAAEAFYGSLLMEAEGTYRMGKERLSEVIKDSCREEAGLIGSLRSQMEEAYSYIDQFNRVHAGFQGPERAGRFIK